jgi:phage repressor protein C with HTH and peptisase S24 domain
MPNSTISSTKTAPHSRAGYVKRGNINVAKMETSQLQNLDSQRLGEWLKSELKRAEMKQADLARQLSAGLGRTVDRATVNKMISGRRAIAADELIAITRILGVEMTTMSRNNVVTNETDLLLHRSPAVLKPAIPVVGEPDHMGGNRLIFPEDDCVEWTFSPPGLENTHGIYAVYVHGTQMSPRYRPGEMVWINPNKPLKCGDDVIVRLKDVETAQTIGIIREFVALQDRVLVLARFNPSGEERYTLDEVISIHPIVFCSRI